MRVVDKRANDLNSILSTWQRRGTLTRIFAAWHEAKLDPLRPSWQLRVHGIVVGAFGEASGNLHSVIHHLAASRVQYAGPQKGRRGRDRVAHLLLTENVVNLCSKRSSQGLAGETRRDGPWCCRRRHEKEQCSPSGKETGSTKEGWLPQQHTGEKAVKKGPFQDWLTCHLVTNFSNSHQFQEGSTSVLKSPFA